MALLPPSICLKGDFKCTPGGPSMSGEHKPTRGADLSLPLVDWPRKPLANFLIVMVKIDIISLKMRVIC